MDIDLRASVVRILKPGGTAAGTGFVITEDGLIATCSHVVQSEKSQRRGDPRPDYVDLVFHATGDCRRAKIEPDWWRPADAEDVAILCLDGLLPASVAPIPLGTATKSTGHPFRAFGYPEMGDIEGAWASGVIQGLVQNASGHVFIQLASREVDRGLSGGPVLDETQGLVVGMVIMTYYPNQTTKHRDTAFALPSEVISELCPLITMVSSVTEKPGPFLVPFPRNPGFVGRDVDLAQLHGVLQMEGPVAIRPAGLVGMGGIGKTQLAVEYAYRYYESYPGGVFWFNAANPLPPQLVDVADQLRLTPADPSSPDRTGQMVSALAAYLQEEPQTLLIFDNVADPAQLREEQLGAGITAELLGGRLLFTTRRKDLPTEFRPLDLTVLSDEAAQQMILAVRPNATEADLAVLCRMLGNLPLALELAAAALRRRSQQTVAAYIAKLREWGADTLHQKARVTANDLASYYATSLTPALRTQWAMLESDNARLLFRVAGQLPEAAFIPAARMGFLAAVHDDPDGWDAPLGDALQALRSVSLIESISDNRVRLHPLVRDFAAAQTPEPDQGSFRQQCALNLITAYEDFAQLEANCAARGIDALQEDLLTAMELLTSSRQVESLEERIQRLLRLVQMEAHNLRGWNQASHPAFFAQQVYIRAANLKLSDISTSAATRLNQLGQPYLMQNWRSGRESPELERTLSGHYDRVMAVAVTPDGRRAVSGADDQTLIVWELETGQIVRTLRGHTARVHAVAVTPDGQQVVSASNDGTLKLWNLQSGRAVRTIENRDAWTHAVAVTPDGRWVIAAMSDFTLRMWNLQSGRHERTFGQPCHDFAAYDVVVTSDGNTVICAATDRNGTVHAWNLNTGEKLRGFTGHSNSVRAVAVTPDGRQVLSASKDGMLYLWSLQTSQIVHKLQGHGVLVHDIAVTPNGQWAVCGMDDGSLKVWNLSTGQEVRTLSGHSSAVRGVAVTPDGQRVISASMDGTLKTWNISNVLDENAPTRHRALDSRGHSAAVRSVAVTPDGRRVVSASDDCTVRVWDLATGREETTLTGHGGPVWAVSVTPDGQRLVSASGDRTLRMWELDTQQGSILGRHRDGIRAVAVTPDGRCAVSASRDQTLKVWNLHTGRQERTLRGHRRLVRAVAVTPDSRLAISASDDHTIRVWDLATGSEKKTLSKHTSWARALAVTPDGRQVIAASSDRTLRVWDLVRGVAEKTVGVHEDTVLAVTVFLDGQCVISASDGCTLRVWDLATGDVLAKIALDGALQCVAVAPDENTIAVGDAVGNVYCLRYVGE